MKYFAKLTRKTLHNTGFPLLLGLRLRFCLRGKQAVYSNFFFQFNSVFLFWSVFAAATDGKPGNVMRNAIAESRM
jgi:hypothetical protein